MQCDRERCLVAALLLTVIDAAHASTVSASIKPGIPWFDTDGNLLDAHGAGLLQVGKHQPKTLY